MTSILRHAKHNAIAYLALFIALGGTGYAAVSVPAASVGTRQLKNHTITPIKFDRAAIAGYMRDYAQINAQGQITAARPGARLLGWEPGGGLIQWDRPIPSSCFALATTTTGQGVATYASAQAGGTSHSTHPETAVFLSSPGAAVNVAIMCPEP